MQDAVTQLVDQIFGNMNAWIFALKAFSAFTLFSFIKNQSTNVLAFLQAKWNFGPSSVVEYKGDKCSVKEISYTIITLEDDVKIFQIRTTDWKELTVVFYKDK